MQGPMEGDEDEQAQLMASVGGACRVPWRVMKMSRPS